MVIYQGGSQGDEGPHSRPHQQAAGQQRRKRGRKGTPHSTQHPEAAGRGGGGHVTSQREGWRRAGCALLWLTASLWRPSGTEWLTGFEARQLGTLGAAACTLVHPPGRAATAAGGCLASRIPPRTSAPPSLRPSPPTHPSPKPISRSAGKCRLSWELAGADSMRPVMRAAASRPSADRLRSNSPCTMPAVGRARSV